jgi:hypothetical protein
MKMAMLAAVAALALTGCDAIGGSPKASMVKACVDGGEAKETCTCFADSLEGSLDKETFALVAKAAAAGEEEGQKMLEDLPVEKQGAMMGAMMSAGMSCAVGAMGGG